MAVVYKVGWLVGLYARLVVLTKYVSIINIVLGREVVPEFLQDRCHPDLLAAALAHLLTDENAARLQKEGFDEFRRVLGLGGEPPARKAARAVQALLSDGGAPESVSTQIT